MRLLLAWLVYAAVFASAAVRAGEGDWPQVLGPNRNGVAFGERLLPWPVGGPKAVWQIEAGSGFAGAAVRREAVVLYHRQGDEELVELLAAADGSRRWRAAFPARYVPSFSEDDGPRVVPIIAGDRVFTYGAMGELRCLELATGKLIWERKTFDEFNSKKPFRGEPPEGYFGIGSSPIIERNKIIVNVGGDAADAGVVAFALDSGKTLWKATAERASYSSPLAATIGETRHLIFVTRLNVVSLDPDNGNIRFQFPFGRTGPTVNAASPVVFGDRLLVTASYGVGSVFARITAGGAEVLWRDPDILASQYTTCIEKDGLLYGIDGRQDGPPADLKCIDPAAQKTLWTVPGFGYATLLRAGDALLILKTDGTLVLAAAEPQAYRELARAEVTRETVRALPALADGRLYVRDTGGLKCLELRATSE